LMLSPFAALMAKPKLKLCREWVVNQLWVGIYACSRIRHH
jgi:hypothetical protein